LFNEVFIRKLEEPLFSKTPQNNLRTLFEMDNKSMKDINAPKNVSSTRQSTESNELLVENKKFFTPNYANSSKVYNVFQAQR
jgi:hypothetical protein